MTAWLMTTTFYGQWLPGDDRGSVTNVLDRRRGNSQVPTRREHSQPGLEYEGPISALRQSALKQLKEPPIAIELAHAEQLLEQFQETSAFRSWILHAVSIMFNHLHLVVEALPAAGKKELLRDFKSFGARRLNRTFGRRVAGTWWSESGSCRVVRRLASAIFYICHRQLRPLLIWRRERGRIPPEESHPDNVFAGDATEIYEPPSEPPISSEPPASAGGVSTLSPS